MHRLINVSACAALCIWVTDVACVSMIAKAFSVTKVLWVSCDDGAVCAQVWLQWLRSRMVVLVIEVLVIILEKKSGARAFMSWRPAYMIPFSKMLKKIARRSAAGRASAFPL